MASSYTSHPLFRYNTRILLTLLLFLLIYLHRPLLTILSIATLPITWTLTTSSFYISSSPSSPSSPSDSFDLTFTNYSLNKLSSSPEYPDLIPPVLHHISLGGGASREEWITARNACLAFHPDWETHFWTDENAGAFVRERFPGLWDMWEGYRFPIQRIDALRYLVLWEYGGAVLDMDLECRRSLGPLRRFSFVAPAAHPVGFSNGMMMASKGHPFVSELIRNLPIYNWNWLGLPYATVMFSTGCHYASTIHALQPAPIRNTLRILGGTPSNPTLHRLNGRVTTPLFHHLGASSWHSFDAHFIVSMGKLAVPLVMFGVSCGCVLVLLWAGLLRWRRERMGRKGMEGRGGGGLLGKSFVE